MLKEFLTFTNLKGQMKNFIILLILTSFLYCSAYTIVTKLLYGSNILLFYALSYVLVIGAAFVYMLVIYQFVKTKRKDSRTLSLKDCRKPLFFVQTIFYLILCGLSILSYYTLVEKSVYWLQYLLNPIMSLLILLYLPWQFFSILYIIDGEKKPFLILKKSLMKMKKHYQSVFYSFFIIGVVAFLYFIIMKGLFNYQNVVNLTTAIIDIMLRSNPFILVFEFMGSVFDNTSILYPVITSFIYGFIMCLLFCYYAMMQICIYDEDVKN